VTGSEDQQPDRRPARQRRRQPPGAAAAGRSAHEDEQTARTIAATIRAGQDQPVFAPGEAVAVAADGLADSHQRRWTEAEAVLRRIGEADD